MQLKFIQGNVVSLVSDSGEELFWDVSAYERTRLQDVENVFKEANQYLESLTKKTRNDIFIAYKDIHETLQSIADPSVLSKRLTEKVAGLYGLLPFDSIIHWYSYHGKVILPDNLKTEYERDDPPDRTYLKRDYERLVILTIAIRFMIPIWGEYILRIKAQSGSIYKESAAMRLLGRCHDLLNSEPMLKLKVYVEKSIPGGEQKALAAIFRGLGTAELPEYYLSLVVVRRLSVGDVNASNERGNVISNIYGFLSGSIKDIDRKFGGGITEKHREDESIEDEASSLVETYKVKQEVPAGDIAVVNVYLNDASNLARAIDPNVTKKMVQECVRFGIQNLDTFQPELFQEVLSKWLVDSAISEGSVVHLNRLEAVKVMCACQAVLWHWGFYSLAALMTARVVMLPDNTMMATETRLRIPNNLTDRLCELYPYFHPAHDVVNERKLNVGCKSVRALSKEIYGKIYQLTCPPDLIINCPKVDNNGRMAAPEDLAEAVSNLAIKIAEDQLDSTLTEEVNENN